MRIDWTEEQVLVKMKIRVYCGIYFPPDLSVLRRFVNVESKTPLCD